jgi:hypothetical protein
MQRVLTWAVLALAIGVLGCKSAKTDYGFRCTHRAVEAGFCEELNASAPDPIKEPM